MPRRKSVADDETCCPRRYPLIIGALWPFGAEGALRRGARYVEADGGVLVRRAFDRHRAARLARPAVDLAEPEAAALADFLRRAEGLRYAGADVLGDVEPAIG